MNFVELFLLIVQALQTVLSVVTGGSSAATITTAGSDFGPVLESLSNSFATASGHFRVHIGI
jgi:hypothetical protein